MVMMMSAHSQHRLSILSVGPQANEVSCEMTYWAHWIHKTPVKAWGTTQAINTSYKSNKYWYKTFLPIPIG